MNLTSLKEEIEIELESMRTTVDELLSLRKDIGERNPSVREKTATAAFLAQFYGGIENVLKRICRYYNFPIPAGDTWHIDLFRLFCEIGKPPLPVLFDAALSTACVPFRKFRHVVHHGYGFQLD